MSFAAYCTNGHLAGAELPPRSMSGWRVYAERNALPQRWEPFCSECGSPVHERCPKCKARFPLKAKYCRSCGEELPWTATALAAAREAVDAAELLSSEEQATLKSTLPDLATETPRTPLAISRFQQLKEKAGPAVGSMLLKIMGTVIEGEVKRKLGL
jgi:hypothetical protein